MTVLEMWEVLIRDGIATDSEVLLVTSINGFNTKTMCDVLYVRTGYRDFETWTADALN